MGKNINSFFKNDPLCPPTSADGCAAKVLPSSQPLLPLALDENEMIIPNNNENNTSANRRENCNCPICKIVVKEDDNSICCTMCQTWVHQACLHMDEEEFNALSQPTAEWFCARCRLIKANQITWGEHVGEENIGTWIKSAYATIIGWKKNIFRLPRGKCGSDFIKELTRLINLFVDKTQWERLALSIVHIFIPLMLQKPGAKSKPREHTKYLISRLDRWKSGQLKSLMDEATEIQRRIKIKPQQDKTEANQKAFVNLMLLGKVGDAAKKINNDDAIKGVHQVSNEIREILQQKHPESREAVPEVILPQTSVPPQAVIYEDITAHAVYKIAKNMRGSGGPTQIDSDIWKHFLCSKAYGNAATDLCQAVADMTKILCTEVVHHDCLTEFIACRLVPLDKGETSEGNPGVRPVGVGEVLRRITGKLLLKVIKEDITTAAGPLQTCTGVKAGIEAAIHAMRQVFEDSESEGVLLADAENAFNNLNREAALQNIKELCPPFYQYLHNTYQTAAEMIIPGERNYETIYSEEGSTQGDVGAMGEYGIATKPLINKLSDAINSHECKQAWFADDSSAAGKILELKKWWDLLCQIGPQYGYFPLARKSVLIVKPEFKEMAEEIFFGSEVKITAEGERHMGAVIGSQDFKEAYVTNKVLKWIEDVEELTVIGKEEPQAVYSCFTKAICHRWTYIQRTIPGIDHLFLPLEAAIRKKLIPAIIGRDVSDIERRILALPVRLGGMGIADPTNCSQEFAASTNITANLTRIIINQELDFSNYNHEQVKERIASVKAEKERDLKNELQQIKESVDNKMQRILELSQEKGSGAWLSALPIQSLGYTLNKQEFRDSVCLRYGWNIPNTPSYCQCKAENNLDHALNCKLGGYVGMRHNRVRDLEASLMKEVCHDVQIEPELLPIARDGPPRRGITAEKARLDVAGVGVWGAYEKTYLDIRIMHPNSPTYVNKPIQDVYALHEQEKKRNYNERVLQVERGSFTPIVGSTFGGWGKEAERHHKRIATLIALKKNEEYADVIGHIRTRLRFSLLKSILTAVRGVRGKSRHADPLSSVSFNLIER